ERRDFSAKCFGAATLGLEQRLRFLRIGGGRCGLLGGLATDAPDGIACSGFGFLRGYPGKIENERLDRGPAIGIGKTCFERDETLVKRATQCDKLIRQRVVNCKPNARKS